MTKYPLEFNAITSSAPGINEPWSSIAFERENLQMAIPKEFEGKGDGFSPEDLYLLALTNCFVATFKFAAEKSALTFSKLDVSSKLVVDLDENKKPIMKEVHLFTKLYSPSSVDKARRLTSKIEGSCLILNSVKTQVFFHHEILE